MLIRAWTLSHSGASPAANSTTVSAAFAFFQQHGPGRAARRIDHNQYLGGRARALAVGQRCEDSADIRLIETRYDDGQTKILGRFRRDLERVQLMPSDVAADDTPAPLSPRHGIHRISILARKSIDLLIATSDDWIEAVLSDFDTFLLDHANCERKASALAMSLVVKYPDRQTIIGALIDLAQEELQHFREVYALVEARGLELARDEPDPYVNELLAAARHGRDARFIDRMLIASVVECRGAERFGILARALPAGELQAFYDRLWKAETKHGHLFVHLLLNEYPEDEIYPRLQELMRSEAQIVRGLPLRPALH